MKRIRKNFKIAGIIFKSSLALWAIETVAFQFVYGWHWEAIGVELYFDRVVAYMWLASFTFWTACLNQIIKAIIHPSCFEKLTFSLKREEKK